MIKKGIICETLGSTEHLQINESKNGNFSQIPIVLLTANAVSGVKERMIKEGFDAFLLKPIDIDELTEILKQYMGEEVSRRKSAKWVWKAF